MPMAKDMDIDNNQFGKTSQLKITASYKDDKTILEDVYFTAPYKIMRPFTCPNGSIQVMLLAASAGIMEGDRQEFNFQINSGANIEFTSQSYDKIHQMKTGCAKRYTDIHVAKNATFCFNPQPTIPFKDSAFENRMVIHLEDETSAFQMSEIFSCGRYIRDEKFAYRFYHNFVEIYRGDNLIYRDNTRYNPQLFDMMGMGMYENFTHLANIFVSRPANAEIFATKVHEFLQAESEKCQENLNEETNSNIIEGEITRLCDGDYAIRIFGNRAQKLEELTKKIFSFIYK